MSSMLQFSNIIRMYKCFKKRVIPIGQCYWQVERISQKAYLMKQRSCFPALEGQELRGAPEGIPYETAKLFPRPERVGVTGCPRGYRKRRRK